MTRLEHTLSALRRRFTIATVGPMLSIGAACYHDTPVSNPPVDPTLDQRLRQALAPWGIVPIGPQPAPNVALVDLGRSLFFDKLLSGNRDISCGTCHDPLASATDGLSLAVGTGAIGAGLSRTPGTGHQFGPRNAPSIVNVGTGFFYMFWDGRVNEEGGPGRAKVPAGITLPGGLDGLLASQAMLPVLNRQEMRGERGELDRFGNPNELAQFGDSAAQQIWDATMRRILAVQAYVAKFNAAYPLVPTSGLGFQHAANAIAAFETHMLTRTNSPFDRYLAHEDRALTDEAKRGAIIFFGRAPCASCHFGPLLGGQTFANAGVPQMGPGVGKAAPLDAGRGEELPQIPQYKFAFRAPPLRNVELTAPYMHNGIYQTLEAVVAHYSNVDSALRAFNPSELPPALRSLYHGDAGTISALQQTLDGRLRQPMNLTPADQRDLVAFLKSLTDPAARNLSGIAPEAVPSGLPVR